MIIFSFESMIEKKNIEFYHLVLMLIFFFNHTLKKKLLKLFFQIVGSYLELMNMNHAWLSKSVEKYHLWLWYHLKNIEFVTRGS